MESENEVYSLWCCLIRKTIIMSFLDNTTHSASQHLCQSNLGDRERSWLYIYSTSNCVSIYVIVYYIMLSNMFFFILLLSYIYQLVNLRYWLLYKRVCKRVCSTVYSASKGKQKVSSVKVDLFVKKKSPIVVCKKWPMCFHIGFL